MYDVDSMDLITMQDLQKSYRRMRWFVAGVTLVGIVLSVTLNVLHAPKRWDMQTVGAFAPIAVFLAIEMVSRIPVTGRLLGGGRILASLGVGAGAGYISYLQQVDYLLKGGYTSDIAHIFPGIIDGLTVVATLSLVEVTRMLRKLTVAIGKKVAQPATVPTIAPAVAPVEVPVAPVEPDPEPAPVVTTTEDQEAPSEDVKPTPMRRVRRPRQMGHPGTGATGVQLDAAVEVTSAKVAETAPADA